MFLWIILAAAAIWAIVAFGKEGTGFSFGKKKDDAIDLLKQRFAKGEITEEEYEERKAVLENEF